MLKVYEKYEGEKTFDYTLTLAFDLRQKSRFKAELDQGVEVGLQLTRGTVLRGGDLLAAEDGNIILIKAADEKVSYVETTDNHLMSRACYHLGNRHVPLQIGEGWLRYAHDHVLDDMLKGLGLQTECIEAPFEPESGAYSSGSHSHGHSH